MDKELAKEILIKAKKEYKNFCKNQIFCERCEYKTPSSDRIDCFEKFYTDNFEYICFNIKK